MLEQEEKKTEYPESFGDDYQISLDPSNPDFNTEAEEPQIYEPPKKPRDINIKRIVFITIGVLVLSLFAYQFVSSVVNKPETIVAKPAIKPQTLAPPPSAPILQKPPPAAVVVETKTDKISSGFEQRLSTLEQGQQNLMATMNGINNQLDAFNTNTQEIAPKIAELRQMLTSLTAQVARQSNEITALTFITKTKPKRKPKVKLQREQLRTALFYIQAIIPGRAWLIAENGSTITVREGTPILGYGVVRVIDAQRGRVITSSGKIIRFSQQDS